MLEGVFVQARSRVFNIFKPFSDMPNKKEISPDSFGLASPPLAMRLNWREYHATSINPMRSMGLMPVLMGVGNGFFKWASFFRRFFALASFSWRDQGAMLAVGRKAVPIEKDMGGAIPVRGFQWGRPGSYRILPLPVSASRFSDTAGREM